MANKGQPRKTDLQNFVIEEIPREQIQNADYNPRIIDDSAKKKLKENLKKHGLISTIVWNKRTGNLVSGHQRLQALDSLEHDKNYSLDVAVVNVDEREEKILNVQMNNPSMQGDWDIDMLGKMNTDFGIKFDEFGFDDRDVDFLFDGDERFSRLYDSPEVDTEKNTLAEIKDAREDGKERLEGRNNIDFFSMIVFKDEEEKKKFYKAISIPLSEEYLTVEQIKRIAKSL